MRAGLGTLLAGARLCMDMPRYGCQSRAGRHAATLLPQTRLELASPEGKKVAGPIASSELTEDIVLSYLLCDGR